MSSSMDWSSRVHTTQGRIAGSYVYFFCCASDTPGYLYIKIGVTDYPTDRLATIASGCGLRPLTFGTCNIKTRKLAMLIERSMHKAFREWQTLGEWFRFHAEEKSFFAKVRDEILQPHRSGAWPMRIEVAAVMPIMKHRKCRQLAFVRALKRQKAKQDFQRHQVSA